MSIPEALLFMRYRSRKFEYLRSPVGEAPLISYSSLQEELLAWPTVSDNLAAPAPILPRLPLRRDLTNFLLPTQEESLAWPTVSGKL